MIDINLTSKRAQVPKICVIGGGSFATAIVKILADNKLRVYWWMRDMGNVNYIKEFKHNPKYLSSVEINTRKVRPTNKIRRAVRFADVVILAVPAAFLEDAMKSLRPRDLQNKVVISAIKGLVPSTNDIIADYIHKTFEVAKSKIGVIGGPCHAEEVAREKLSFLTIASGNAEIRDKVSELIDCRYLKTRVSTDVVGTEYASVIKNVYALATGVSNGLNYGDNLQAVLVANAQQEMTRFINTVSKESRDTQASHYLGDLLVTAYSQFSRNRTFGIMLGRGYSVDSIQIEMDMVAEGYYATKSLYKVMEKYNLDMPILRAVYEILYNNKPAPLVFRTLINELN